jgi:hypothetical protein
MRPLRRIAVPLSLGFLHVRRGGARTWLVLAGIAVATASLAAVLAASVVAQNRSLARAVDELPPPLHAVRVGFFGVPGQSQRYPSIDAAVHEELRRVADRPPVSTVLFRESSLGGAFVSLGAVDGLGPWLSLRSGRLPARCRPSRCEVVLVRGGGRLPQPHGLRIIVVGRGVLRTTVLFGDAVPAERNQLERAALAPRLQQRIGRYHQPPTPPLLLADGVRVLARAPALAAAYRSYGWVLPLEDRDVRTWRVRPLIASIDRARAALAAQTVEYDLVAPTPELGEARNEARVGARRLLLLGGQAAALALAFAAFAATGLRRSAQEGRRRLTWLGTPPWQVALVPAAQATALGAGGALVGWTGASAAVALLGGGELVAHSLLSATGLVLAGVAALAAAIVVGTTLATTREGAPPRLLDGIAVALVAAIALSLARGAADTDQLLAQGGTGIVLLVLPAAAVAVAAILAARLLAPALRALARAASTRALDARLAAVTLARRPGAALAAVAFLVVSVAFAFFAEAYRETLAAGQRDRAAFALGADLVLREDLARLIPVREVATPARLRTLDATAAPVLRASGNVPGLASATGLVVLGLEPSLLRELRGWRPDFSQQVPAELAADIRPAGSAQLRGARLPPDARVLRATARSSFPGVTVEAIIRQRDGSFTRLSLERPVKLPAAARGGLVTALRLVPPSRLQERGADAGRPAVGTLSLGPLLADEHVVSRYDGWIGTGGASPGQRGVRFTLTNEVDSYLRPKQPTDAQPVPVVASPRMAALAGRDGLLPLQVAGMPLRVRVVAEAARFPSARGDFAIADRTLLETALNVGEPGSGSPTEAWIDGASPSTVALLRRSPWDVLVADSIAERERTLRADPLARISLSLLAVAAAIALVLALLAVALATIADAREDRAELIDLEAQGAAPATLRRVVRLRQLLVVAVGIAAGIVTGLVLTALVVSVVAVAAGGERPEPPLVLELDAGLVAAGVAALALAALALVVALTRGAFGGPEAGRA